MPEELRASPISSSNEPLMLQWKAFPEQPQSARQAQAQLQRDGEEGGEPWRMKRCESG